MLNDSEKNMKNYAYDLNHRHGWIPAWEKSEARKELMESCNTKLRRTRPALESSEENIDPKGL